MKSSIRLFIILNILSICHLSAQNGTNEDSPVKTDETGTIFIDAGVHHNLALGSNFLNDAYQLKNGLELGFDYFVFPKWFIGLRFDFLGAEAIKPDKIGNINSTFISTIGANGGYFYQFHPKWDTGFLAGIGYAKYSNDSSVGTNFHDKAVAVWFQSKTGYSITNKMVIFGAAKLRNDFMLIETSPELEDYFNNSRILNFTLGVRISTN